MLFMSLCPHCNTVHGRPYCCGCSYGTSSGGFCPSVDEIVNGYFEHHGCKIEPERRVRNIPIKAHQPPCLGTRRR